MGLHEARPHLACMAEREQEEKVRRMAPPAMMPVLVPVQCLRGRMATGAGEVMWPVAGEVAGEVAGDAHLYCSASPPSWSAPKLCPISWAKVFTITVVLLFTWCRCRCRCRCRVAAHLAPAHVAIGLAQPSYGRQPDHTTKVPETLR